MGKNKSASNLVNVIDFNNDRIAFISGSTTLMSISSSGAITTTGVISGSNAASASYALNAGLLNNKNSAEFTSTGSFNAYTSSNDATVTSVAMAALSAVAGVNALAARTSSYTTTSSFNSYTASNNTTMSCVFSTATSALVGVGALASQTGSYATTGSNTFVGGQYLSSSFNPTGFSTTASLYTDGGLRVTRDAYISGTLYLNNVTVFGTQSVAYISSSQLNIGTNLITVNTDTPSIRFGGLAVYDSGSTGLTGSILWDSQNNHWVYSNPSGSSYSGGMFISGPRTSTLGSETGTTSCMLLAGQGGDHLTSSMIYHSSTVTCFHGNSYISGSGAAAFNSVNILNGNQLRVYNTGNGDFGNLTFATSTGFTFDKSACFNGVVCASTIKVGADTTLNDRNLTFAGYPTSVCFGNGQSIYDNGAGGLAIGSQAGIQLVASGSYAVNITPAGNVGIGTTTPCRELHARGEILFQARSGSIANNSMYRFIPRSTDRAFQFQLMSDSTALETTVWSVCRNDQTVTSFNIENGSVGIGTCAPESKLHMYNANNPLSIKIQRTTVPVFLSDVQLAGTTAGAVWSHNLENTSNGSVSWGGFGNTVYAGSAIILQSDTGNSFITLHTATAVNTVPTERLRIGGAGTFGFNCSGVAARTMVVKGVTGCYIVAEFIEPAGVHSIEIYPNKNSTNHISSDYMSGGTFLPLSLSGRECSTDLVLGTNGKIGIGNGASSAKFQVYESGCTITSGDVCFTTQAKGMELYNPNSGTTDNIMGYWFSTGPHKTGIGSGRTNAAANWEVDLRFYTHPTTIGNLDNTYENMRLYGGGNLTINGTLTQNGGLSDCRQKENLIRISNPLSILSCISGYNFEWKEGSPARRDFMCIIEDAGLIAQEVETVMPNIVRETKYDCLKTLNYNGITALLVEGMKAQQCTINTLKTCLGIS
jgi:hypothetical protein